MQLSPGVDLPTILAQVETSASFASSSKPEATNVSSLKVVAERIEATSDELQSSDDEYNDHIDLAERENPRFWGKSSGLKFIQFAMDSRNVVTGQKTKCTKAHLKRRDEYWGIQNVRNTDICELY